MRPPDTPVAFFVYNLVHIRLAGQEIRCYNGQNSYGGYLHAYSYQAL